MNLRLILRLGWALLRSRLTLTVLAVILLALGTAMLSALGGSLYLLADLQSEFLSSLSVELELAADTETGRAAVMERVERWPSVDFVQYVPPDLTLREMEKETGENLTVLFGGNPFPAMVRVRFSRIPLRTLDSLAASAQQWSEVQNVSYPRQLWNDLEKLATRLRGEIGVVALVFTALLLILVGLALRAQVRNMSGTWEFLQLSGVSRGTLQLATLLHCLWVGLLAGLGAMGLLFGLTMAYSWLFFREVAFPVWFYLVVWGTGGGLAVIAGLFSPPAR